MISFPSSFVKLKYPGYFWNVDENALYSIKVGGVLKKMKLHEKSMQYGKLVHFLHYRLSHEGKSRSVSHEMLVRKLSKVDPANLKESVDFHK